MVETVNSCFNLLWHHECFACFFFRLGAQHAGCALTAPSHALPQRELCNVSHSPEALISLGGAQSYAGFVALQDATDALPGGASAT